MVGGGKVQSKDDGKEVSEDEEEEDEESDREIEVSSVLAEKSWTCATMGGSTYSSSS
jgi:hypothetical protein